MMNDISTQSVGKILEDEFMKPINLSAYKLAQDIGVPVSRIQDIIHDRRKVSVDTSLRFARYFGVSDKYFLDIQNDIDIRNAKNELEIEIETIGKCDYLVKLELQERTTDEKCDNLAGGDNMYSAQGYYDGENIRLLEAVDVRPNQKVIVTVTDEFIQTTEKKKSLRGALSSYANPSLIEKEKDAWKRAMVKKHGND